MTAEKYFSKIIFQRKCVLFFYFYLFLTVSQKNAWRGNRRSGSAGFCENLVASLYIRTIGVCGYGYIHHGKSVDMDVDGKFHVHGKPANLAMVKNPIFRCGRRR